MEQTAIDQLLPHLSNLGIGGVIAVALVWAIYKIAPQLLTTFREEMAKERETCLHLWQQLSDTQARNHAELMSAITGRNVPPNLPTLTLPVTTGS